MDFGLKKYRQHLLGQSIIVRTDHAALTYHMKMPQPVGQQGRWLGLLDDYDIIQHRPGRVHGNSDALSQHPCERSSETDCHQCPRVTWTHAAEPMSCDALLADGLRALPAPLHFLPLHSQADKSSDLSIHKPPSDIAPDLLEVPEFPVWPRKVAHTSPTNDIMARTQVLSVTAEPSSLSLDEIREAKSIDDNL